MIEKRTRSFGFWARRPQRRSSEVEEPRSSTATNQRREVAVLTREVTMSWHSDLQVRKQQVLGSNPSVGSNPLPVVVLVTAALTISPPDGRAGTLAARLADVGDKSPLGKAIAQVLARLIRG